MSKNKGKDLWEKGKYCVYMVVKTSGTPGKDVGSFQFSLFSKEVNSKEYMKRFSLDDGTFTKDITCLGAYRNKYVVYSVISRLSQSYKDHAIFEDF